MIGNLGKAAIVAGKAIGKFAMDHKEEAVEIGKKALSAVAIVILDSIRRKIDDRGSI